MLNGAEVVELRTARRSRRRGGGARRRGDDRRSRRARSSTRRGRGSTTCVASRIPRAGTSVRLSKGVHVLVPGGEGWTAALTIPQDDVRVTFAVPWYGMLLLGTTDDGVRSRSRRRRGRATADVDSDPRRGGGRARAGARSTASRVRATYAGLRVLPAGPGESVSARRETVYTIGRAGMLSVAGGKLTTYRRIALEALDRLRDGPRAAPDRQAPLAAAGRGGGDARLPVDARAGRARSPAPPLRQPGAPTSSLRPLDDPSLLERLACGWARHRRPGALRGHERVGAYAPTTCCVAAPR